MLNMAKMDEDEYQEYQCLLLEGYSDQQARKLARAANDRINSRRLSGPMTGDVRNGHGDRPLISDMTVSDIYEDVVSITQNTPEYDEDAERRVAERVELVRQTLPPSVWRIMVRKFGLDGNPPAESIKELAEQLGLKPMTVNSALQKARQRCAGIPI
jgi:DNA-directed RNA polymerase specialized sigma24 family protein